MPPQQADVNTCRAQADELEKDLKGHLFLGGNHPSKEDVEAFNTMFGEDNIAFYRWIRNVASFTVQERASWPAPEK